MVSEPDWGSHHTHFYGIGPIVSAGNFSNGSTPMFAVIGADNICYYNGDNIFEVGSALNLAIESFETIELIADFSVSSSNIYLGDEIQFTDNSIGEPTTWEWDFENDGVYDSSEQYPTHLYDSEGTYSVKLKITRNTTEDTLVIEDLVTVENIELIADFTVSPTSIYLGDEIQFTDSSIGEPVTWEWDFENDGIYDSSVQHPAHVYDSEGTYSVKLKITRNATTDILIKEDLVTVESIPPSSPQNMQIQIDYPNVIISWSEVETNVLGEPITPDGYIVIYSNNGEDYYNLRTSRETTIHHNGIAAVSEQMFYQVMAYIDYSSGQGEYLESLNSSPVKINWIEVKLNLDKLARD